MISRLVIATLRIIFNKHAIDLIYAFVMNVAAVWFIVNLEAFINEIHWVAIALALCAFHGWICVWNNEATNRHNAK